MGKSKEKIRYEGQIFQQTDPNSFSETLVVDAEPHIMLRLRKIFDTAKNIHAPGKYTHRPIAFPITLSACRDLIWLFDRYSLNCDAKTLELIRKKADEYDDIVRTVSDADSDPVFKKSFDSADLAVPLREHQIRFNNMFKKMRRMLLADKIGAGKTASGLSILTEPASRPALIVVPPNLCTQWERELKRFLPSLSSHVIRGFKNYSLPAVDVLITSYNRLTPWQDVLMKKDFEINTVVFDEVQELRHTDTGKRDLSRKLSEKAQYALGLSGTPIYNMGSEIWSVLDVIKPDCLGTYSDFITEWCQFDRVNEPATLNNFLKKQGLMLRRTDEEIGLKIDVPAKHVITLDADLEQLKKVEQVAKMLALSVLSGNVGEDSESSREFDWKLRHATGVAKARPAAEFVKMLLESEEKVVVAAWHRDTYDILLKELKDYKIAMYTGSESVKQKDEAVKSFIEGDSNVFIISLRSGAGLDGLQKVCNTIVFAEIDWSPHIHDQVIGRLARDGQTRPVNSYFLTINDGADPFMIGLIGDKRSQHDGLIEGITCHDDATLLKDVGAGNDRIREMAKSFLLKIGEDIPEPVPEVGAIAEITKVLKGIRLPTNAETDMQSAAYLALQKHLPPDFVVEKEVKITKRSRLDFLVTHGQERVAIECKIASTKRTEVYRQVRRYVEEGNITSLILLAPWHGIASFKVDGTPVVVCDTSANQI